ncbi:P-loop containing nucleoside triphosphate hydrolase protein [Melampsora americana]|nr:P-loop containing nucleoside triphosphate hydrolase protein [Melampsora americana]
MPKIRKKTSKRGTTRMREKVKHKVKEAHKKAKKHAKKDVTWKTRVKKDIGIPNLFPYKEQVLNEQQQAKEQVSTSYRLIEKQNQKLADSTASTSAAALAATIEQDDHNMDLDHDESEDAADAPEDPSLSSASSLRAYAKSLRKVLMLSDVVVEVLDARDPLGTRSIELEKDAVKAGKKVLLILNKVDLVPKESVESWLKYLRRSWPTLPFKCSTQNQRNNLSSKGADPNSRKGVDSSSNACSTQPLMHLLKNYARYSTPASGSASAGPSVKSLASITVGVIGFPNVGKSSLINTLKRSKACGVAPTPGYTKDVQEIALEKGLKILDCPGVVVESRADNAKASAARVLRNAVKVEQIEDPLGPVGVILDRCKAEHLMLLYNVPAFTYNGQTEEDRTKEFLIHVARSRGRVKKGGIPDLVGTARSILRDWNSGRIPYYTIPPALPPAASSVSTARATIMNEYGVEFDFEALFSQVDEETLGSSKSQKEMSSVVKMKSTEINENEESGIKLLGEIPGLDDDEDEKM